MLDIVINIGFAVLALIVVGPVDRFIERRTNRTYEEAWRRVQEETRTKGVAVGELAKLLGRNTVSK